MWHFFILLLLFLSLVRKPYKTSHISELITGLGKEEYCYIRLTSSSLSWSERVENAENILGTESTGCWYWGFVAYIFCKVPSWSSNMFKLLQIKITWIVNLLKLVNQESWIPKILWSLIVNEDWIWKKVKWCVGNKMTIVPAKMNKMIKNSFFEKNVI